MEAGGFSGFPQERLTESKTLHVSPRGRLDQVSLSHCSPLEGRRSRGWDGVRTACQGQGRGSWESAGLPWGHKRMSDLLTGSSSSQVRGTPELAVIL